MKFNKKVLLSIMLVPCQIMPNSALLREPNNPTKTLVTSTNSIYAQIDNKTDTHYHLTLGAYSGWIDKSLVDLLPDTVDSSNANSFRSEVLNKAIEYLGVPYVWGGTTPNGFDCSGLVQYVYNFFNIHLPRVAEDQCHALTPVSISELLPADLVFFSDGSTIHHVGLYYGNGLFLHAPHSGSEVKFSTLNAGHYHNTFYCGGRVIFSGK